MMPAVKVVEVPFVLLELEVTSEMRQMSFVCSCWEGGAVGTAYHVRC